MSFVVEFHLIAVVSGEDASQASRLDSPTRQKKPAFDHAFGEALARLAQTPQVSRQDRAPTHSISAAAHLITDMEYIAFAEDWRIIYNDWRAATRLVAMITGSPVAAIIADAFLEKFIPSTLTPRAIIDGIRVNGQPASEWLAQFNEEDRNRARDEVLAIAQRAQPTTTSPENSSVWPRSWIHFAVAVVAILILTLVWSALDALVRNSIRGESPPPTEFNITITQQPPSEPSLAVPRPNSHAPSDNVQRCNRPVRVQRGTRSEQTCGD